MTTATGEVAYNFASSSDENPWTLADGGGGDPFVVRNGMTARIITNALRPNFDSNGYCCYVGQAVDQNDFEVKGETLQGGGSFGDQVGVGAISPSGNGYILWINGNLWRIYQIDAFVIGGGVNLSLSHNALDVISLQYSYSGGTATLTAKQNGSTVGLSLVDSTSPYNGNLEPCWFFNFDNSNAGGFRSIAIDGIAASVTIDTYPATVRSGSTGNAYTTTGLSSVSGITIGSLAATSISDASGDGTHSVPSLTDGVTHELYGTKTVTVTGTEGAPTTSTSFQPLVTQNFVTLSGTLNTTETGGLYNFSPAAVVTDQIVFPSAGITYDAQGNITGEAGTYNCWHIQASTKIARSYTVTLGEVITPPSSPPSIDKRFIMEFIAANAKASQALGYQQITNLSTAVGLTIPKGTSYILFKPNAQAIRFRDDGTNPTASIGYPVAAGAEYIYTGNSPSELRFIQTATSATLDVLYYGVA